MIIKGGFIMNMRNSRRTFFKHLLALSAFSGGSFLSFRKVAGDKIGMPGPTEALAMNNPDYAICNSKGRVRMEYMGMSCFLITSSNGTRIINDPFFPDLQVLHPDLRKEPADVITVSCGHYAHCNVSSVGGMPYIYQITEPTELHGIRFRGVSSRHLTMSEIAEQDPGENIIMCFEVDNIRFCHLGALGHRLSDEQVEQVGKVDILMVPVGGVSTLPMDEAYEVCIQLNPKVIIPMNYRSERCTFPSWASLDDFLKDKQNVLKLEPKGFGELAFKLEDLPAETQIIAPSFPY
jgi:L-ascorbate metabolism protein UlaG (beta-lactamase superfamily)